MLARNQVDALAALANGIIPADETDCGAASVDAGLRLGETCALAWADVDLAGATVHVQRNLVRKKGGAWVIAEGAKTEDGDLVVDLTPETVAALRAHRAAQIERIRERALDLPEPRRPPVEGLVGDEFPVPRRVQHCDQALAHRDTALGVDAVEVRPRPSHVDDRV